MAPGGESRVWEVGLGDQGGVGGIKRVDSLDIAVPSSAHVAMGVQAEVGHEKQELGTTSSLTHLRAGGCWGKRGWGHFLVPVAMKCHIFTEGW